MVKYQWPEVLTFNHKIVNRVFDNVLVDGSEIFINFSITTGVRKPQKNKIIPDSACRVHMVTCISGCR